MKIKILIAAMTLSWSSFSLGADLANGKKISAQCSVCHGKNGISRNPEAPHLAGMSSLYFKKSIEDYQKGNRQDRRMSLIAAMLKQDQIVDLAAWYESIEIEATLPEL
jgi:cytochrome c553